MKLKMLLESFDFDEIYPSICNMYPNAKRHKKEFKKAYDIMMDTLPVMSKKTIHYKLIEDSNSSNGYIGALDSDFKANWNVLLGKEIQRGKYADLSNEEVAANSLLNAIFIGNHPEEYENCYNTLIRS
ncbi:MAG: hypothetical protein PUH24_04075 [Prevotellaceae bacterium]|nr:hypothetical protein [Prevotella sp.]MDD7257443.1 hypothetical protein [Prevotellaceae bacterium]MDY6129998.1 hypothetical protein [Prevotella sp.]